MKDKHDGHTMDIFNGDIVGMVPSDPTDTQVAAAEAVVRDLSRLQARVMEALATHGPMTDMELEALPELSDLAESTAGKRRTELYQRGRVRRVGKRLNANRRHMIVWGLVPPDEVPALEVATSPREDSLIEAVRRGELSLEEYGRKRYQEGYRAGRADRIKSYGPSTF